MTKSSKEPKFNDLTNCKKIKTIVTTNECEIRKRLFNDEICIVAKALKEDENKNLMNEINILKRLIKVPHVP